MVMCARGVEYTIFIYLVYFFNIYTHCRLTFMARETYPGDCMCNHGRMVASVGSICRYIGTTGEDYSLSAYCVVFSRAKYRNDM